MDYNTLQHRANWAIQYGRKTKNDGVIDAGVEILSRANQREEIPDIIRAEAYKVVLRVWAKP